MQPLTHKQTLRLSNFPVPAPILSGAITVTGIGYATATL